MKYFRTLSAIALLFVVIFVTKQQIIFLYLAFVFLAIGIFVKPLAALIHNILYRTTTLLSTLLSKALLTLAFYLLLTPLAFLRRILRGDFFFLRQRSGEESYFVDIIRKSGVDLEKPW